MVMVSIYHVMEWTNKHHVLALEQAFYSTSGGNPKALPRQDERDAFAAYPPFSPKAWDPKRE